MNFLSPLIELICFLASLALFFQGNISKYLKTFPFFLLITITVEFAGYFMKNRINMILLYNIFTTFEFVFYLFVIGYSIYNILVRKVILGLMAVYPLMVYVNTVFFQTKGFHTVTYSVGCLLIVAASIYYFFELFQSTHSVKLGKEPAFWICSGLLFFYTCTFPLIGLWNHLHGLPDIILRNLNAILQILNILLYSLFSIAFLCKIRFRKMHNKPSTL
jgi:hypothetical protein